MHGIFALSALYEEEVYEEVFQKILCCTYGDSIGDRSRKLQCES